MNCEELAAAEERGPAPSCSAPPLLAGPPEGQVNPQPALVVPLPLFNPSGSFLSPCSDGRGQFQALISYPGPSVVCCPRLPCHLHVPSLTPLESQESRWEVHPFVANPGFGVLSVLVVLWRRSHQS